MDPSPSSASASPAPPPRRATSSPSSGPRRSLKRHKALGTATSAAAIAAARAVVAAAVATIVAGAPLATSYSDAYAHTERLCRSKHQEMSQLADAVLAEIGAGFAAEWQPQLRRSVTTAGGAAEFITVLSRWQAISETLSKVLLPLDRGYLRHHSTKPSIRRRCMMLVVEEIKEHTAVLNQWHLEMVMVKQPVTSAAMSQLVFQVSEALPEAKLRTSVLERLALVYTERGSQWLTTEPNYVARCLSEIASEISYWQRCGYPQSFVNDLRKRLKWAVVFSHFDAVAAAALPQLLAPGAAASTLIKALVAMCRAASDDYGYDAVAALRHQAQSFLTRQFDDVIATHTRRKRFVSDLVSAYHQWRHRFAAFTDAEPRLEYAWRQSFTQAVNGSAYVSKHVALHLCRHCDTWFKHHPTSWAEFKREVLVVFEALNAKSAFVASYRQFVAKRLLSVDGVGPDYVSEERGVVDGFAGVIGDDDANIVAIRRMVTDWATSRDQYSHLYANDDDVNPDNIDVNVLVLRHDDWRDVPKPAGTPALVVPPVFQKLVHRFAQDYASTSQRHQRQRLDWTNWWTHKVTLAVAFDRGTREVQGNMVHASVVALLCAGGDPQPQYTEAELTTKLGVEAATTERIVSPLVDKGLIVCDPTTQLLRWNFAFDDGSDKKIKLSVGKDKASAASASATPSEAVADAANADAAELAARRHQLQCQCVLMRVMKQEHRLGYAQLMHRCLDYFEAQGQSVSPRQLKREMDALLAADDLKRLDNGDIEYVP
ncbi:hypothetical protein DIURU_004066 [Diutina rugosa]|uniref:Cullin family profile domain-containing protein n=1 Tax=Diutina rugosa TaxID=5481 RepID=A0A642UIT6_DIURU|nr:uncharacterized protein DIURU_004066 [Diutina rugosa]KAA8899809.1 hypothetical protein DIURU_004066 [Diutina rugosa]